MFREDLSASLTLFIRNGYSKIARWKGWRWARFKHLIDISTNFESHLVEQTYKAMISSNTKLKHWMHKTTTTITVLSLASEKNWLVKFKQKLCIEYTGTHGTNFENYPSISYGTPNANAPTDFDSFAFIHAFMHHWTNMHRTKNSYRQVNEEEQSQYHFLVWNNNNELWAWLLRCAKVSSPFALNCISIVFAWMVHLFCDLLAKFCYFHGIWFIRLHPVRLHNLYDKIPCQIILNNFRSNYYYSLIGVFNLLTVSIQLAFHTNLIRSASKGLFSKYNRIIDQSIKC